MRSGRSLLGSIQPSEKGEERRMLREAARRIGALIILVLLVFLASKAIIRLLPGDPVEVILAETGADIAPALLRERLGLDQPFLRSTFEQLQAILFHGDWGSSLLRKQPIGPLLAERAFASFSLSMSALLIALLFSFALALMAQFPWKFARPLRVGLEALSALSIALPTAWIGPILALVFAVQAGIFTLSGGFALPCLTLALALCGFWLRAFSGIIERALRSDVVRTARAKGLPEIRVIWKHAFIPSSGPLFAYLGSQTGVLLSGTVITETTFDRPGLGSLMIESIFRRDYPLIESILILTAAFVLTGNFLGDLLQQWVEPRLRNTPPGEEA
jgi:ABC-type dipeptide/oligopeptide/nickel transport system permease component